MNTRPVEVSYHEEYWKGQFHGFFDPKIALVETEDGKLVHVDLTYKSLKFLDTGK